MSGPPVGYGGGYGKRKESEVKGVITRKRSGGGGREEDKEENLPRNCLVSNALSRFPFGRGSADGWLQR